MAGMTNLTAAETQALAALAAHNPMTLEELGRAVTDTGMHLGAGDLAAAVNNLTATGLAERTPAATLGRFRITAKGRQQILGGG